MRLLVVDDAFGIAEHRMAALAGRRPGEGAGAQPTGFIQVRQLPHQFLTFLSERFPAQPRTLDPDTWAYL